MEIKTSLVILNVLILVLLSGFVISYYPQNSLPVTTTYTIGSDNIEEDESFITRILGINNEEKASPHNWIGEENIRVYEDRVVINIQNAEWARFTNTNSMDPVIDYGANAIEIRPKNPTEIHVGDIVSYESVYSSGTIIHRVIEIGYDEQGWYAIMKGDNNSRPDPGKVRFKQIQRIVVAIIY